MRTYRVEILAGMINIIVKNDHYHLIINREGIYTVADVGLSVFQTYCPLVSF